MLNFSRSGPRTKFRSVEATLIPKCLVDFGIEPIQIANLSSEVTQTPSKRLSLFAMQTPQTGCSPQQL